MLRAAQHPAEVGAGDAVRVGGDVLRPAFGNEAAAARAAIGAEFDHPVGAGDDVEVVLDDDDGVAGLAQLEQHAQQQFDVGEVQAGGGLVEDVKGAAGVAFGEFERQLHPLRLAARQGDGRLPEADIAQPHVLERLQLAGDGGHRRKGLQRLLHREFQRLRDAQTAVGDFEGFAVVALAAAHVAGHVEVGHEVHFHLHRAVALAGFAAPALDVEGKSSGVIAALARHGRLRVQLADGGEQPGVGGRIAARGAADGRLIDCDHLVELIEPVEGRVGRGLQRGAVEFARAGGVERVVDQGGFTRTRHPRHAGDAPQRKARGDVVQIVAAGAAQGEPVFGRGVLARLAAKHAARAAQISAGDRVGIGHDGLRRTLGDDAAAVLARARAHVHHMIGAEDSVGVVLDHQHAVAQIAQPLEGGDQPVVVALVQADGRLVEHVHHPGQPRADLAGQADALRLAA